MKARVTGQVNQNIQVLIRKTIPASVVSAAILVPGCNPSAKRDFRAQKGGNSMVIDRSQLALQPKSRSRGRLSEIKDPTEPSRGVKQPARAENKCFCPRV